jgi:hypothetical protein
MRLSVDVSRYEHFSLAFTFTTLCCKDMHSKQSKVLFALCFIKYSPVQTKFSDARFEALTTVLLKT